MYTKFVILNFLVHIYEQISTLNLPIIRQEVSIKIASFVNNYINQLSNNQLYPDAVQTLDKCFTLSLESISEINCLLLFRSCRGCVPGLNKQ